VNVLRCDYDESCSGTSFKLKADMIEKMQLNRVFAVAPFDS